MGQKTNALKHAFHASLPIMAGYGFLGLTYGIYMHDPTRPSPLPAPGAT